MGAGRKWEGKLEADLEEVGLGRQDLKLGSGGGMEFIDLRVFCD